MADFASQDSEPRRRKKKKSAYPEAPSPSDTAISDPRVQIAGEANFGRWRKTVTQWNRWQARARKQGAAFDGDTPTEGEEPATVWEEEDEDAEDQSPQTRRASFWGEMPGAEWLRTCFATCCPTPHDCWRYRIGTWSRFLLLSLFIVVDAAKFMTSEWIDPQREMVSRPEKVNVLSIVVVQEFISLIIALVISFAMEGREASEKIFDWHPIWRFLVISCFFTLATMFIYYSYDEGASAAAVATIGNSYLPVAAALSFLVMKRMYGKLEWLSLGIITFAVMTFILLRQRAVQHKRDVLGELSSAAVVFILLSVLLSVIASILSERIYKDRSLGIIRANQGQRADKFYIHKVHLDFSSLLVAIVLWTMPPEWLRRLIPLRPGNEWSEVWFGPWGLSQVVMICVAICQAWLAGIISKHFSTVVKAMAQTISSVLVILVLDPIMLGSWTFDGGKLGQHAKVLLAIIIFFAAFIFQTGRLNIRMLKRQMGVRRPNLDISNTKSGNNLGWRTSLKTFFALPKWEKKPPDDSKSGAYEAVTTELVSPGQELSRSSGTHVSAETGSTDEEEEEDCTPTRKMLVSAASLYSSMVFFILADSARTLSQQAAQSRTMITPISMVLACFILGVAIAAGLTFYSDGVEGLKLAFDPQKTIAALPCAAFFALSSTLLSLAYAQGIGAALATVLGYIYMPCSALASRWVLGKYYMWLEWVALIILTMACAVFGVLQQYYEQMAEHKGGGSQPSGVFAMLLVILSAISSVFGSLVAEKILKGETLPFHIQKVRLDMGSTITTVILLPVIGWISTRDKDAFWKPRPLDMQCMWLTPECTTQILETWPNATHGCANEVCVETCGCGGGLFVGWNDGMVLFALLVNVVQGWLGGKVAKQFSTVMRAIAQSLSLIVIYVVGDTISNSPSVHDLSMTFMALIVPLSTCIFLVAVGEMEKVMILTSKITGNPESSSVAMVRGGSARQVAAAAEGA